MSSQHTTQEPMSSQHTIQEPCHLNTLFRSPCHLNTLFRSHVNSAHYSGVMSSQHTIQEPMSSQHTTQQPMLSHVLGSPCQLNTPPRSPCTQQTTQEHVSSQHTTQELYLSPKFHKSSSSDPFNRPTVSGSSPQTHVHVISTFYSLLPLCRSPPSPSPPTHPAPSTEAAGGISTLLPGQV